MNHEQLVDSIIEIFTRPGFPVVLSYDEDAEVRIGIREGYQLAGSHLFAQPGESIVGTVDAHTSYPLKVVQGVLQATECGFVPKGVIRDTYRELTRRECNRRAFAAGMAAKALRAAQKSTDE